MAESDHPIGRFASELLLSPNALHHQNSAHSGSAGSTDFNLADVDSTTGLTGRNRIDSVRPNRVLTPKSKPGDDSELFHPQ